MSGDRTVLEVKRPPKDCLQMAVTLLKYRTRDMQDAASTLRDNAPGLTPDHAQKAVVRAAQQESAAAKLQRVVEWMEAQL